MKKHEKVSKVSDLTVHEEENQYLPLFPANEEKKSFVFVTSPMVSGLFYTLPSIIEGSV